MKKKILGAFSIIVLITGLSSCGNKQLFDTTYTFTKAEVSFPDGTFVEIEIDSWSDYADGDQIQIKSKSGIAYLFHSSNIVLKTK